MKKIYRSPRTTSVNLYGECVLNITSGNLGVNEEEVNNAWTQKQDQNTGGPSLWDTWSN